MSTAEQATGVSAPRSMATGVTRSRRGAPVAALALALAAAMTVPGVGLGDASDGESVATLSPTMVEMLDGESSSGLITLADLRSDVLGEAASDKDGAGIDVALIDTGVAPVDGLNDGRVLHGPDLSFEGAAKEAAYLDTYGHGTHMAGIIAGNRAGHPGIAPAARIVSLKVAGHDGVTTVPQVVAAIDWVVEHRNTDGLNIRVLNLSLGQTGVPTHQGDILSAAVERAWHAGVVVVVAGGNDGAHQPHLDSPAIDPYVIAIGAVDSNGKIEPANREVPKWSAMGDGIRDPDVVAPGRSIASYRVAGSTIDNEMPAARYGDALFRGSGTSQSAAATSGLAAALLARYPKLTPDQVKATIETQAFGLGGVPTRRAGDGHIDGRDTLKEGTVEKAWQKFEPARTDAPSSAGATWSGGSWSKASWSGASWSGMVWTGASWSGASWSGASWSGASWSGASWSGASWSGASWSGASWSGASWSGASWSGQGWS